MDYSVSNRYPSLRKHLTVTQAIPRFRAALMPTILVAFSLLGTAPVFAAEWKKVTENAVSDRFFVDQRSIQRNGATILYWEYRDFPQANNALLGTPLSQPIHGAVMRWSLDCANQSQRLKKVNAYTKNRKLIQKFEYGETGLLLQPKPGSSTYNVMNYVCSSPQAATQPPTTPTTPASVKIRSVITPKKN